MESANGGFDARPQARVWLEHQPHVEQVPQLAVGSPDVLGVQPLFNEAELSIEANRSLVVREDAQCQLVQTARFSPLDRGGHQLRPYSASAPLWGDEHPDLPESEAAVDDEDVADDFARSDRDEGAVQVDVRRALLHVDRWLRGDAVALLGHSREEQREWIPIRVVRAANLDGVPRCHGAIVSDVLRAGDCAAEAESGPRSRFAHLRERWGNDS